MKRLLLVLALGLGVSFAYLWAGLSAHPGPGHALTQPDAFFYTQSARRLVEGRPFSFSEGTAVSSGTTSVLYPFVLAVPYALGATGVRILLAGWAVNAAFFLIALVSWWLVAERRIADRRAGTLFMVLLPLFGQFAFCTFDQSDIGFLVAASSVYFACLWGREGESSGDRRASTAVAAILPWVRPEGFLLALLHPLATVGKGRRLPLFLPWLSIAAVFAFNFVLTGEAQFSSVAQKGYFKTLPFVPALGHAAADAWSMAKTYLFGWTPHADPEVRAWYFPPLLFALFAATGVFVCARERLRAGVRSFQPLLPVLAVPASFLMVAVSGWQGTNMDRYLAWTVPLILLAVCRGAFATVDRFRRTGPIALACSVVFFLFNALMMLGIFRASAFGVDAVRLFWERCEETMEKGAAVGVPCECMAAYSLSPRRVVHLMGIYSPELFVPIGCSAFETLKREPATRFAYWLDDGSLQTLGTNALAALGTKLLDGPKGRSLKRADWSAFDAAARDPEIAGRRLVARVDVGYAPDEAAADFEVVGMRRAHVNPFVRVEALPDGTRGLEAGVFAPDGVAVSVPLQPGRPATLVMRVLPDAEESAVSGFRIEKGKRHELAAHDAALARDGFTDLVRTVSPGEIAATGRTRIAIPGPLAVCALWFYQ